MNGTAQDLRPVCYMVMPFRKKKVEEPRPTGAPAEINFDKLWERAYWPAIEALGYMPMRADFDPSSAIVKAMLERIAFADLVLADVSLGNGNVYYEVGIRHVARETNCVLLAPEWCKPLFDISQFASIRFPLANGDIPDNEAAVIRDCLVAKVPGIKNSRTPYYELTKDAQADRARRSAFRDFAERLNAFQAKVKAVRLESDSAARKQRLSTLRSELKPGALEIPEIVLDLVELIRDELGWQALREFIDSLPAGTRNLPFVREQDLLAEAELGDPLAAITQLEKLIQELGDTPERRGLIGGRYKRLWRKARIAREQREELRPSLEERRYLDKAIENYSLGMELDYNQYYCSCNLSQLLRVRGEEDDVERAVIVDHFVVAACERARKGGVADEWLRPTLLGAAFRAGDSKQAAELAKVIRLEGAAAWKLKTTLADLKESLSLIADTEKRDKLQRVYDDLAEVDAGQGEKGKSTRRTRVSCRRLTRDEHFSAPGPKRILALDGGGLRGVLSLGFLAKIEAMLRDRHGDGDFRLAHYFDLIAGTSTGAIIAAALAKGLTTEEVANYYMTLGRKVFKRSWFRRGIVRARYDEAELVKQLKVMLGAETRIGGPEMQTGLLIMTKRADTGSPWPIGNNPAGRYYRAGTTDKWISNADYPLCQVVRASTAAPSFFDSEKVTIARQPGRTPVVGEFMDGGTSPFNNPAFQAFMYATLKGFRVGWETGADRMLLISVGTGMAEPSISPSHLAAHGAVKALLGLMDDCGTLVETLMQWVSESPTARVIDREIGKLDGDLLAGKPLLNYQRYNVSLAPDDVSELKPGLEKAVLKSLPQMDAPENLEILQELGTIAAERQVKPEHFPQGFDLPE